MWFCCTMNSTLLQHRKSLHISITWMVQNFIFLRLPSSISWFLLALVNYFSVLVIKCYSTNDRKYQVLVPVSMHLCCYGSSRSTTVIREEVGLNQCRQLLEYLWWLRLEAISMFILIRNLLCYCVYYITIQHYIDFIIFLKK